MRRIVLRRLCWFRCWYAVSRSGNKTHYEGDYEVRYSKVLDGGTVVACVLGKKSAFYRIGPYH